MRQAIIIRPATTPPAMPPFAPEDKPLETSRVGGGAADVVGTKEDYLLEAASKTRNVGETIVDVREGRYNLGSDSETEEALRIRFRSPRATPLVCQPNFFLPSETLLTNAPLTSKHRRPYSG